jgi:colanic acid biosynthesis glycosyl transferase WcaI
VLLHAGNLGFYGAWETLVTAVSGLQEEGVCLVFVGEGAQRARIESLAKGTPNVRFFSFFPASKIPSVLAAPDAHVITVKRGLEGVVVPSKMYGILAAGKPILAVAVEKTDVASLGAKSGFAVSADPDRPDEVASAILSLARDRVKVQSMGRAARAVASDYDRVKELQKFVKIIEEAVNA